MCEGGSWRGLGEPAGASPLAEAQLAGGKLVVTAEDNFWASGCAAESAPARLRLPSATAANPAQA